MSGPLNLADADTRGFDPLDAGRYNAEVFKCEWDAVKNADGTGKMPAGTPMLKVQFKILEPIIDGEVIEQDRRVFSQYVIPPADYDKKKRATMTGMFVRFLTAIGEDEAKVKINKYDPDLDDFIGRPCVVVLGKKEYPAGSGEYQNEVKGVKPAESGVGSSGLL